MKPMIKWSGGKRGEIPFLKPHYPQAFERVVEPFSGGAAVAWDLEGVPAVINDVNHGLILFYRSMQDAAVRQAIERALKAINDRRQFIHAWVSQLDAREVALFYQAPESWVEKHRTVLSGPATHPSIDQRTEALLLKHGKSKAARVKKLQDDQNNDFSLEEQVNNLETALQSAFYEALREVYNGQIKLPPAWEVAAWWSVRVLCYSGMFRFSSKGLFNVPYGGISYNARDFSTSFGDLFGPKRVQELSRFVVESSDFEELFEKHDGFTPNDFVFLDPPYDSTFSQYNAEADFTRNDQERLRDCLLASKAKWMLVIKRTDYIQSLYENTGNHCYVFDKTYMVNFRNRHDRGVQHLVVTNYPLALEEGQALRPLAKK